MQFWTGVFIFIVILAILAGGVGIVVGLGVLDKNPNSTTAQTPTTTTNKPTETPTTTSEATTNGADTTLPTSDEPTTVETEDTTVESTDEPTTTESTDETTAKTPDEPPVVVDKNETEGSGLSEAGKIGIAVGVGAFILLAFLIWKRRDIADFFADFADRFTDNEEVKARREEEKEFAKNEKKRRSKIDLEIKLKNFIIEGKEIPAKLIKRAKELSVNLEKVYKSAGVEVEKNIRRASGYWDQESRSSSESKRSSWSSFDPNADYEV